METKIAIAMVGLVVLIGYSIIMTLRGLFPVKDIKTALNIELALSSKMLEKIELWQKCYSGNADWLNEEKGVSSLVGCQGVFKYHT